MNVNPLIDTPIPGLVTWRIRPLPLPLTATTFSPGPCTCTGSVTLSCPVVSLIVPTKFLANVITSAPAWLSAF